MENYVRQLIEEIDEICANDLRPPMILPGLEEGFAEPTEAEYPEDSTLPYWTGIDMKMFPPDHRLTTQQMEVLCEGILKLFKKINIEVHVPKEMPADEKYKLLLKQCNEAVPYFPVPGYHIDFCSGGCDTCEIFKYCKIGQELMN
jgi:hypothetical protein